MKSGAHPLVLIPGWAATARVWDGVRAAAAPSGAVTVTPWWRLLDAQDRAAACAMPEGGAPAVLAGWSLGALLALHAALEHPAAVHGLVLVSATARFTRAPGVPGADPRAVRAMRAVLLRDRPRCLDAFFTTCLEPLVDRALADSLRAAAEPIRTADLDRGLEYLLATDLLPHVSALTAPAVILHGDQDAVIPLDCAQTLQARLPHARGITLRGHGHALPLSAPEAIAQAIRSIAGDGG